MTRNPKNALSGRNQSSKITLILVQQFHFSAVLKNSFHFIIRNSTHLQFFSENHIYRQRLKNFPEFFISKTFNWSFLCFSQRKYALDLLNNWFIFFSLQFIYHRFFVLFVLFVPFKSLQLTYVALKNVIVFKHIARVSIMI
jgi:hypothetical protein